MRNIFLFLFLTFSCGFVGCAQNIGARRLLDDTDAGIGAARMNLYLDLLKEKNVAVVTNHTGMIGDVHLVDTLMLLNINIKKIFSPEHGFRGTADEGAVINDDVDAKTGLKLVSLYGNNKKPTAEQLSDVDVVLFDLQDVGTRFYTYISTLTYVMEAAAENDVPVIVLDRPNPNGFYVDGPVLEEENASFVGLHCVPVVYGLTIGEYAEMVNGEGWMKNGVRCDLTVVPMSSYDRNAIYRLSSAPSPNLRDWQAVYLYPSLCFFEGTCVSVGRGTDRPFTRFGHPLLNGDFAFTPTTAKGHAKPLLADKTCRGKNLVGFAEKFDQNKAQINLEWLMDSYNQLKDTIPFFNKFFVKLAGTNKLQKQVEQGLSEDEIRASWQPEINTYLRIRERYLIY